MAFDYSSGFQPLTGVYEPSAIVQLADGRFLVVEDEKDQPFTLLRLDLAGGVETQPLRPAGCAADDTFWKLDDLEGLAVDARGFIHAVTSHSRTGSGKEKPSRDKLVRFRIEADQVRDCAVARGLKPVLVASHPALAEAAARLDVKGEGGLNVEALEFDPVTQALWVGLRSPLLEGRAVLACIERPAALFEDGQPDCRLIGLDLAGQGLRALAHVPDLDGYLLVSGPVDRAPVPFRVWRWSGRDEDAPSPLWPPDGTDWAHAEGLCPARLAGESVLVVVSDDGDRALGRPAGFRILRPAQLVPGAP